MPCYGVIYYIGSQARTSIKINNRTHQMSKSKALAHSMISLLLNRGSHQRQNLPYVKQVLLCPPEASQEQVEYHYLEHRRVMFKNQSHPPHPPRPIPVEQSI